VTAVRLDALAARAEASARAAAPEGRELRLDWRGGPAPVVADRARLSQALANLTANALEHGSGAVEIRGRRRDRTVRIEIRDAGPGESRSGASGERGRGLAIAADAARDAGGRLLLERSAEGTTAAMELPLAEGSPRAR
jgi:signal transduction histidine kinase